MADPPLTDRDRADRAQLLREVKADRCPLPERVRRRRELLAKVDPVPYPAPKPTATEAAGREAVGAGKLDAAEE
jgi:hypothetical protein